jgi:hypothetical protein
MLSNPGPTSNAERQRQFRARNPGYFRKYSARLRAISKKHRAEQEQAAYQAQAEMAAVRAAAVQAAVKREPLMLPAPVVTIEIPGMTTIDAIPTRESLAIWRGDASQ